MADKTISEALRPVIADEVLQGRLSNVYDVADAILAIPELRAAVRVKQALDTCQIAPDMLDGRDVVIGGDPVRQIRSAADLLVWLRAVGETPCG